MPRRSFFLGRVPRLTAVLLLLSGTLYSATDAMPDRTLTMDDSVHLAMNNSQALLSSREDVNIALQRVRQAESLFFPKLDLNANWSKFSVADDRPLLLQPALGPTLVTNSSHPNFYTARANIYQPVYEGGRLRNTWRQARISYERARSANETLQTQVAVAAKRAFYNYLQAQEKAKHIEDLLRRLEPEAAGTSGSVYERIRIEDGISELREEASVARLAEQDERLSYLRTLNLELNTNVVLKGELKTHTRDFDLQKLLAWATQYRSELRQTEFQQELDALGVSLSLAERNPTIGFGASYERTGNNVKLGVENWAGTLNINLPISISDMFYGFAKVREHRAEYRQATLRHAEVADQVQMQVRQAFGQYRHWQGELVPRQESVRRLTALMNQLGPKTNWSSDRLAAERSLLAAKLRYEEAVHGHLSALASLERAVGHNLTDER